MPRASKQTLDKIRKFWLSYYPGWVDQLNQNFHNFAFFYLEAHKDCVIINRSGFIQLKVQNLPVCEITRENIYTCINYLCEEWDYAYEDYYLRESVDNRL